MEKVIWFFLRFLYYLDRHRQYRYARLKEVSENMVRLELALQALLFTIAIKEWGLTGLVNPVMQIRKPKLP
jgi:hypothetical protein